MFAIELVQCFSRQYGINYSEPNTRPPAWLTDLIDRVASPWLHRLPPEARAERDAAETALHSIMMAQRYPERSARPVTERAQQAAQDRAARRLQEAERHVQELGLTPMAEAQRNGVATNPGCTQRPCTRPMSRFAWAAASPSA